MAVPWFKPWFGKNSGRYDTSRAMTIPRESANLPLLDIRLDKSHLAS